MINCFIASFDLFCIVGKFHYVWTIETLVKCPFYLIDTVELKSMNKYLFSKTLIFQTNNSVVECNTNMIPTTEGLYLNLLQNSTILSLFRNSSTNTNEVKSLMISDFDHKTFTLLNMIEDLSDSVNKKLCIILASSIDTHKRRLDEYFMIKDEFLNNIIVYNNFGA